MCAPVFPPWVMYATAFGLMFWSLAGFVAFGMLLVKLNRM